MEVAIGKGKGRNPITVSQKVKEPFFKNFWLKDVSAKIKTRPNKFPNYEDQTKIKSLNDLVFEALGSQKNAEDFVLCESGINSMKAKLWSNEAPFEQTRWQRIARDAADGAIPSTEHLSGLRTVRYPIFTV
jgi:hypothetical protein